MSPKGLAMTGHVLIPPELVDPVRDGLRSQLAVAAQHIVGADEQLGSREHPERYRDPLRSIDALRALLHHLGWSEPPSNPHVDLQTHGWALIEALQDQVSVQADMLRDIDHDDERRETLVRALNALMALALTVLLRTHAHILRDTTPLEPVESAA
jgi:hypothetical protein